MGTLAHRASSIMRHAEGLLIVHRSADSMGMPITARRFTVDEYHRMAAAGVLHEDDRVELLDGQVVEMTPIGPEHGGCVNRLTALFAPLARGAATVSIQNPLVLDTHHEPQPDLALLRYRADGYRTRHPASADALLVVEVGDTSVAKDREEKIPLYAKGGVPEVWLVDLPADRIEVYRSPAADGYSDVSTLCRGDTLAPLAFPNLTVPAEAILG
jgi:Uma2 family endonuclease